MFQGYASASRRPCTRRVFRSRAPEHRYERSRNSHRLPGPCSRWQQETEGVSCGRVPLDPAQGVLPPGRGTGNNSPLSLLGVRAPPTRYRLIHGRESQNAVFASRGPYPSRAKFIARARIGRPAEAARVYVRGAPSVRELRQCPAKINEGKRCGTRNRWILPRLRRIGVRRCVSRVARTGHRIINDRVLPAIPSLIELPLGVSRTRPGFRM